MNYYCLIATNTYFPLYLDFTVRGARDVIEDLPNIFIMILRVKIMTRGRCSIVYLSSYIS